jgi:enamidase
MVAWARKHGIQSTVHTGGSSVPGSGYIDADTVREADTDIIGHINGGHTATAPGSLFVREVWAWDRNSP